MLKLTLTQRCLISTALCCTIFGCETPPVILEKPPVIIEKPPVIIDKPPVHEQKPIPPAHSAQPEKRPNRDKELQKEIEALRQRLIDSYTEYWPLLSSDYQHEQLPSVLGDPIPELRVFGIERVAVLLRDGEATEDELQSVVSMIRDPSSIVRLASAKLLPEINVSDLSEYVAQSITLELNQEVTALELAFFQTRPHPVAVDPAIVCLEAGPVESAAKALVVLLNSNNISLDRKQHIVIIVQRARTIDDLPSLVTLEAMLGSTSIQRNLIHLLDSSNESMRLAVAQGFASAGFAEPLISRADDELLYAQALAALQKQGNIEAFKQLMALYRQDTPNWDAAAFAIASSLDTSSLLRADDMLKRIKKNELRLSVLQFIWEDASSRSLAARKAIARRAVPLMIKNGDAVGALQLLNVFGESLIDEDLLTLRFSAAIAASAWDAAADARPEPAPWITAWQVIRESDLATASVIRQQITQRFLDQLNASQREILGIKDSNATIDPTQ